MFCVCLTGRLFPHPFPVNVKQGRGAVDCAHDLLSPVLPLLQVLYSDSFRRQVQGKAAFVLDTPEMRRVRETQRIISGVRFSSNSFLLH